MKKTLTLSIVIPAYNEENYLEACLKAIDAQTTRPDEVIVVDNNSTDSTAKVAKRFPFVKLVHESKQGIVFGRDAGYDAASSDIIGRIDADTLLDEDWVVNIKTFFESHPDTQAVTGECYFYDFPAQRLAHGLHGAVYYDAQAMIAGTEVLWGSNMALRRTAWETVRGECHQRNDIDEDIDLTLVLHRHKLLIERYTDLTARVSLRRGSLGPNSVMKYLKGWSLVYSVNQMPFRAFAISILQAILLICGLPVSIVYTSYKDAEVQLRKVYIYSRTIFQTRFK